MYFDKKRNRILLRNGESIISPSLFAKKMFEGEDTNGLLVFDDIESRRYEEYTNEHIVREINEIDVHSMDHNHSEEDLDYLISILKSSCRWKDDDAYVDRVEFELSFFDRTKNIMFLTRCYDLVQSFKDNDVVWGVGRGSGSASYVLYLLGVHDVDPVLFDIPFHELSKEIDEEE